jgi:transcriptional regulator with XRE-family HTH domain
MNLNSKKGLIARLRRGRKVREQFVASHIGKGIAHQLRATRDRLGWSQERLAKEVGMNQNAISRLESSEYGKPTITTLKRLAAAIDVGLVVRFVPFSEMIDWVSGTPRVIEGLATSALAVTNFEHEEKEGAFSDKSLFDFAAGAAGSAAGMATAAANESHPRLPSTAGNAAMPEWMVAKALPSASARRAAELQ